MATLPAMSSAFGASQRKRPLTYGKSSRNAEYAAAHRNKPWPDSPDQQPGSKRSTSRPTVDNYNVPGSEEDANTDPPAKRVQHRSEFDFPSSDDDARPRKQSSTPVKAVRPKAQGTQLAQRGTSAAAGSASQVSDPTVVTRKRKRPSPTIPDERKSEVQVTKRAPFRGQAAQASTTAMPTRRSKVSRNATPLKGGSAPARLADMISPDDGALDSLVVSGSQRSHMKGAIPARQASPPRTPVERMSQSPCSAAKAASMTPKQVHLWDQLLMPAPLHDNAKPARARPGKAQVPVMSMQGRQRLVDHLKRDAQPLEDESTDGEDSDEESVLSSLEEVPKTAQSQPLPDSVYRNSQASLAPSQMTSTKPVGDTALGLKVTYARARSFLQEDNLEAELLLALPTETAQQPASRNKSAFDLDDDFEEGFSQGIRSIHELRAAGTKKRFMDDIEHLIDDIRDHTKPSQSRRRSALVELAFKLADKSFVTRFVELGYDHNLAAELQGIASGTGSDQIGNTVLLAALTHVLQGDLPKHAVKLFDEAGVIPWLCSFLDSKVTMARLAKDRTSNMSKVAQSTFLDFADTVRQAALWDGHQPAELTVGVLALKALESLVLKCRQSGVKRSLVESAQANRSLINLATTRRLADGETTISHPSQQLAMSVLEAESTSLTPTSGLARALWIDNGLETLADALPYLVDQSSPQLETLALRLCLNLTNNDAENCNVFAKDAVVLHLLQSIQRHLAPLAPVDTLDTLLLTLGLMINLAEHSDGVRARATTCDAALLPQLVALFVRGQASAGQAASMEQSQGNVAYGYLAVLLGNLCLGAAAAVTKRTIRAALPGGTLAVLVRAVEEFVLYHQTVDSQAFGGDEGGDVWAGFTARLLAVVGKIRED